MATFRVDFLGCKVSHADVHEVREALVRDGHSDSRSVHADVAVISTCCVTNEAVAKSRKASGPRRSNARARLRDGLRREPGGAGVRRAPLERHGGRKARARRPRRSSPATSARSAASRQMRASTACARS